MTIFYHIFFLFLERDKRNINSMVNNIYIYKDPMTLDIVVAHYHSLAFSEILPAFSNRRNNPDGSKETTNILVYDKSDNQNRKWSFFSFLYFLLLALHFK